ncbi:MAG: glycosyltransferase family 2 protein [Pseudomonadota bacterium]
MRIITLSSIPPRFDLIGPTLESLVAQGSSADAVELYIPQSYRRFPDYDGSAPPVPAGVHVLRPDVDFGPASKVLHAAQRHRETPEAQLLFCDDDRHYYDGWAEQLFTEQVRRPDEAVALTGWNVERTGLDPYRPRPTPRHEKRSRRWDIDYRMKRLRQILGGGRGVPIRLKPARRLVARAGYADIFEGYGGVVVRPRFFDEEAYDIPRDLWAVDDVWLSGMLALRGISIWVPADLYEPKNTVADLTEALFRWKMANMTRAQLNAHCAHYLRDTYGVWSNAAPG